MSNTQRLNNIHQIAIGFDHLFNHLQTRCNQGFPPHNLEQTEEHQFKITLAVAGYSTDELEITRDRDNLIVEGKKSADDSSKKHYLYQGIAERDFQKVFKLADNVVVRDVTHENGMLTIGLERLIPEEDKPLTIKIVSK